jgi:hypothetical protein
METDPSRLTAGALERIRTADVLTAELLSGSTAVHRRP